MIAIWLHASAKIAYLYVDFNGCLYKVGRLIGKCLNAICNIAQGISLCGKNQLENFPTKAISWKTNS
jgi:hypothetical protein